MADNVAVTAGSGTSIGADEVVDATLGTVKVQFVKLMDGTLDGTSKAAVGANGLAVDVKAIAAGTNAIGKLAANSGVDIGDVDVTSVIPGTGATNLGKAEDAAHSNGDTGVMLLAVRKDTATALAGTDGDYAPLEVDSTGRLHVVASNKQRTLTWVTGTAASSGSNSIVAGPGAGNRIVVKYLQQQNESATATTAIWEDGTTDKIRSYNAAAGSGAIWQFEDGAEWRLSDNAALQLNLSGANSHGYTVGYWTEAV